MPEEKNSVRVFISYSHVDAKWANRLIVHLKPLGLIGMVNAWSDQQIQPGENWRETIKDALMRADVVVALITADFLASDFIMDQEIREVMRLKNPEAGTVGVPEETPEEEPPNTPEEILERKMLIPLIIKPSVFHLLENLEEIQCANPLSKPLAGMSEVEQEAEFARVAAHLGSLVRRGKSGGGELDPTPDPADLRSRSKTASTGAELEPEDRAFFKENSLGKWATMHLRRMATEKPCWYVVQGNLKNELYELINRGMIKRKKRTGVRTALREGGANSDLLRHFEITEKGKKYLKILDALEL